MARTSGPMNQRVYERIWVMDTACRDCIHAVLLCKALSKTKTEMWAFTQRCFGEVAVIQWCHLFKDEKSGTHFKRLFGEHVPEEVLDLTIETVRARILGAVGLSETDYASFRKEMVVFRDKVAAHKDMTAMGVIFPDLEKTKKTCLELRSILKEVVASQQELGTSEYLYRLNQLLSDNTNEWLLPKWENEARLLAGMQ